MERATPILKLLYSLGTVRLYKNGDIVDFVWRYWNPLSYVAIVLLMIVAFVLYGVTGIVEGIDSFGFTVDPYFKDNNIDIEWIR